MRTNHLKTKLLNGEPALGAWLSLPSVETARIMTRLDFDWLVIDAEHTAQYPGLMAQMIATIVDAGTCAPLVRLPTNSVEWYKWALDAGAWGVIVPMVNTRAEAEQAVRWSRYPPQGDRSFGGIFAPYGFGTTSWSEYVSVANDQILVIIQIESAAGMQNLDTILSVPGLDVVFIGPNDLHIQLGLPPSSEGDEPDFVSALDRIKAAAQRHRLPLAIYCSNGNAAARRVAEGFQMVVVTNDAASLAADAMVQLHAARGAV